MSRPQLTARNLRILQIGIILAVCLALVLAAVWNGNCTAADTAADASATAEDARQETIAYTACFHATALSDTLTAAGFFSRGNLYAYTLIPKSGAVGECRVALSSTDSVNDTLVLRFSAVRAPSETDSGALVDAYKQKTEEMSVWQTALLDALVTAISDAGAEAPADLYDGVLGSVESGKAYAGKTASLTVGGGYTDADDKNVYVLTLRALPTA